MALLIGYGATIVYIRNARPADLEVCATLEHSIVTDHAWRMEERERGGGVTVSFKPIRLPRQVRVPYPRQGESLTTGWEQCDLFLIAGQDDRICGYVTARALPGHGLAWIQDLVVEPVFRRQGLGRQLLQRATSWALEMGLCRSVAELHTRNYPGIRFCRSCGMTFCGYHDRHWRTQDIAVLFGQSLR